MLERFDGDAELVVDGGLREPVVGVGAIRTAYLDRPPREEIALLDARETAAGASGTFAWCDAPESPAGDLHLTVVGGRVTRLEIDLV
jgi:hypothetical protein